MDIATFRSLRPEFSSVADAVVQRYLDLAAAVLNADRWCDFLDLGTELYVSHQLALDAKPGAAPLSGAVNSKSVGSASVGYDVGSMLLPGAGPWYATSYGARFWQLAYMVGLGGAQL